jgi:tRNA-Thr(GGU) m(6)t(6)A37 methyltransferase TsaA
VAPVRGATRPGRTGAAGDAAGRHGAARTGAAGDEAERHGAAGDEVLAAHRYGPDMADDTPYLLHPIGRVTSTLREVDLAPKQGTEGGPEAWLEFDDEVAEGLRDLTPGDEIVVLTWLHLARRDVLTDYPRGDQDRPERGVFSTRSPSRPNPIGLHRVAVIAVEPGRLRVAPLEAVDGTPVLDVKPVRADPRDD